MSSSEAPTEEDTSKDGTRASPKTDENDRAAPLGTLEDKDSFARWQYFEGRVEELKQQMFQSVTWVIGLAVGVLGYIFATLIVVSDNGLDVKVGWLVVLFCFGGFVLCSYAGLMLYHYADRINKNKTRATHFYDEIKDMTKFKEKEKAPSPSPRKWKEMWQVGTVVLLILIAFIAMFVYALLY